MCLFFKSKYKNAYKIIARKRDGTDHLDLEVEGMIILKRVLKSRV